MEALGPILVTVVLIIGALGWLYDKADKFERKLHRLKQNQKRRGW